MRLAALTKLWRLAAGERFGPPRFRNVLQQREIDLYALLLRLLLRLDPFVR